METELYPYNPIWRWLSPQIIMASLLLVPNLMSACTHLGHRGALFSNVTLIKAGNHFQWAVLTSIMRGHLYLKKWTHWMELRSNVVDTIHKAQSNWGLHNPLRAVHKSCIYDTTQFHSNMVGVQPYIRIKITSRKRKKSVRNPSTCHRNIATQKV